MNVLNAVRVCEVVEHIGNSVQCVSVMESVIGKVTIQSCSVFLRCGQV